MHVLSFLNSRVIGNTRNIYASHIKQQKASTPNLDSVISRLACQEKDVYESCGETGYVPPFASKFRKDKYLDLLAVANEDGDVMLIDTSKESDTVASFTAHHNAIYDICWLPDKYRLITVSGDHNACVWDMNTLQNIGSYKRHTESIKSVDVCPNENATFATGSRDGTVCVWDIREQGLMYGLLGQNIIWKPSIHIQSVHCRRAANKSRSHFNGKLGNSVSAVAFQDNISLASTGSADSVVKIWDMRKTYICKPTYIPAPRYQMKHKDDKKHGYGYTSLVFDSNHKKLYACSTANKILMFDCHGYNDAEAVYEGFHCNTYYIKLALSADDQYLACGSSSNKAYVWKASQPGNPKWEFSGHTSEVTTVAWGSYDVSKFVTCGDDNRIFIWKAIDYENKEQVKNSLHTVARYQVCNVSPVASGLSDSSSPTIFHAPSSTTPRNSPPNRSRTPVMKTIKHFFHPLSPDDSSQDLSSHHNSSQHDAPSAQILSPSKKVNQKTVISPISSNISSKSPGKENQSCSTKENTSLQVKRKCFSESTPEIQRHFKKGRRSTNSNVKKKQNSEGNIKNYFTSSISPK